MAIITPPSSFEIQSVQWTFRQPAQVNRSGWTGRRQVFGLSGGTMWAVAVQMAPIIGTANAAPWRTFFTQLKGQVNTFPLPASEGPQHGGSNPTITLGASGGTTFTTSAAVTALKAGTFMTVKLTDGSYQLVQLTADFSTTSPNFLPALRLAPAYGSGSLETINPYCHVALTSDSYSWTVEPGQIFNFAFDAEEAY